MSELTLPEARRFLTALHRVVPEREIGGPEEAVGFVRQAGCIQFDPLDVVGRNAELVLQARWPGYRRGMIGELLYEKRALFDVWDKNMSIAAMEDWPRFHRFRRRWFGWLESWEPAVAEITAHLRRNGFACSTDLGEEHDVEVQWHYYGPQRRAKAVLECMCHAGLAVVHHKRGTRRYYGLAEQLVPAHLYRAPDPHSCEEEYHDWIVLRRIGGIGLLRNRPGDAWLGLHDFKAAHRNAAFARLAAAGRIAELRIEGQKLPYYADVRNLPLLDRVVRGELSGGAPECRFIAPLDNLIWERKQTLELFGFDYRWEVYTPAASRKYGYYVLPVLYGDRFLGRIEFEAGRNHFGVKRFWPEDPASSGARERQALNRALERFALFLGKECTTRF